MANTLAKRAWACVWPDEGLRPCGNGAQWQYPIFWTKREAASWKRESAERRPCHIARVEVREVPRGGRRG